MLHVGLTGGIGSGKSTVASMFKARGACLLDSDRIVRELLKKGGDGYRKVVEAFGAGITRKNGSIDRKKLAKIVFSSEQARRELEKILHPLVIEKRRSMVEVLSKKLGEKGMVVSEAALIYEAGTQGEFDRIILVTAPEKTRIKRLTEKGCSPDEVKRRMDAQFSDIRKRELADFVIDNGLSIERTEKQVSAVYRKLRAELENVR